MLIDQQHRIDLLETILRWEGRLNNSRLRELFDLGGTRTSQWIREFRDLHPDWMTWDTVTRSYHATAAVYKEAKNTKGKQDKAASLAQYLSLVGISHITTASTTSHALWSAFPDLSVPSAFTFAQISEAIRLGHRMQITYRSIRNPVPHQRTISPHSLVRAGRRWHVRAFCSANQEFRDYALGRIESPKILQDSSERLSSEDHGWNTMLKVRLTAHPALNPQQQDLVRFEYFANTAVRVDSCRAALVSYFIQDVRAATDTKVQGPPDYQLAVENIEELRPWLFPG